ncbi:hypothetical protein RI367_000768 [Sorochytrium milnesiophthora]
MCAASVFTIQLDQPDAAYHPGSHITGSVMLSNTEDLRASKVTLELGGTVSGCIRSSSFGPKSIFKDELHLWSLPSASSSSTATNYLPAGQHMYPFELVLSHDIPPSFERTLDGSAVVYTLCAIIKGAEDEKGNTTQRQLWVEQILPQRLLQAYLSPVSMDIERGSSSEVVAQRRILTNLQSGRSVSELTSLPLNGSFTACRPTITNAQGFSVAYAFNLLIKVPFAADIELPVPIVIASLPVALASEATATPAQQLAGKAFNDSADDEHAASPTEPLLNPTPSEAFPPAYN